MKLTVLMPVYNAEKYLKPALESILNQTYKDFEFLIIDDGSTDKSLEIIKSYNDSRIRLIGHEQNQKLIATLNEGIKLAQGEYIARMDADDISAPERLQKQMEFLEKHPATVVLGCDFQIIDDNNNVVNYIASPVQDALIRKYFYAGNPFAHGAVVFKKQPALDLGSYSQDHYLVEDYDLWLRMSQIGQIWNIPEPLYDWRSSASSETGTRYQPMNQAAQKIKDYQWNKFDSGDPMPLDITDLELLKSELAYPPREAREKMLFKMHLLLADGYARKRHYIKKIRHLLAAFKLKPSFKFKLFLILCIFLPRGWILKVKNSFWLYKKIKQYK